MPDIKFHCPHCTQRIGVPGEAAGRFLSCPSCKEQIQIPAEAADVPAATPILSKNTEPTGSTISLKPAAAEPTAAVKIAPPVPKAAADAAPSAAEVATPVAKPAEPVPVAKAAAPADLPVAPPADAPAAKAGGAAPKAGGKKWNLPKSGSIKRPASAKKKSGCPECGAELAPDAVLCTGCGFNTKTGKKMETNL